MVDVIKTIDPKTWELLTSSDPDITYLTNRKASEASVKDALKVVPEVYDFILGYGVIPWDRLNLDEERVFLGHFPDDVKADSSLSHVKVLGDREVYFSEAKVGDLGPVSPGEYLEQLTKWAKESNIRRVSFPFGPRVLSLMIGHPEAEKIIREKAEFPALKKFQEIPLPSLKPEDYLIQFRTDAWKNKENGNSRWLAVRLSQEEGNRNLVNRRMVRCAEAMVTLGKNFFKA